MTPARPVADDNFGGGFLSLLHSRMMSQQTNRIESPARRRWLMSAAAVVLLGAGAYFATSRGGSASIYPDTPQDAVQYFCSADRHGFTYTPRQLHEARQRAGGGTPGLAPCPKCGKSEARRAELVNGRWITEAPPAAAEATVAPLRR